MKKKIVSACIITLFCVLQVTSADNGWGLYGSYWSTADAGSKFAPGGKISVEIIPHAQLDMRAAYFDKFEVDRDLGDVDIRVVPLELGLTFTSAFTERMDGYAGLGVGYYMMDGETYASDGTSHDAGAGDEIGYFCNAAIEIVLKNNPALQNATRITLLVEGMYRAVDANEIIVSTATQRVKDLSFNGPSINIGLMIRW